MAPLKTKIMQMADRCLSYKMADESVPLFLLCSYEE